MISRPAEVERSVRRKVRSRKPLGGAALAGAARSLMIQLLVELLGKGAMQALRRSSHSRWDGRNGAAMAVSRCRDIYSAFRFPRRACPDDAFDIVSSTARGTAFSLRIKLIGEGARQLSGWRSVSRRIDPGLEFGFSRKRHYSRVGATPHSDDSVRPNAKYEILSSPRVATKSRRSTVNRLDNGGSPRSE